MRNPIIEHFDFALDILLCFHLWSGFWAIFHWRMKSLQCWALLRLWEISWICAVCESFIQRFYWAWVVFPIGFLYQFQRVLGDGAFISSGRHHSSWPYLLRENSGCLQWSVWLLCKGIWAFLGETPSFLRVSLHLFWRLACTHHLPQFSGWTLHSVASYTRFCQFFTILAGELDYFLK